MPGAYHPSDLMPYKSAQAGAQPDHTGGLEQLTREECLALLPTVPVGRLGLSIEALPAILPVNFAVADGSIIIRSVPGTKLDAAVAENVVAFEVDGFDPAGAWGWSVLVRGRGSEVTDAAELQHLHTLPHRSWAFDEGTANRFLRIDPTLVSGRRFPPAEPG